MLILAANSCFATDLDSIESYSFRLEGKDGKAVMTPEYLLEIARNTIEAVTTASDHAE